MLVTSSQSSTQRPLGLSVEELFALDRQYRRIDQQQPQNVAQFPTQAYTTSSNLNRGNSRSLDLISPTNLTQTVLPSLEVHGHGYSQRQQHHQSSQPPHLNYARANSMDQLKYTPPVFVTPAPMLVKPVYHQRTTIDDAVHHQYYPKQRAHLQPIMATGTPTSVGNSAMQHASSPTADCHDARASCKLRRQPPIKRESSRRIAVRPVVQRRREPSLSSSCESLDEIRPPMRQIPPEQSNIPIKSAPMTPSASFVADVVEDFKNQPTNVRRAQSNNDSLSDDGDINLYEMRVPIGRNYDTSDISVQLEGPKILIHCHTIEPTDKRGNYRKHEFKTELLIPDVVDDESIVAYLTENGELIVEGKYQRWAWDEIRRKRKIEQQEMKTSSSSFTVSSASAQVPAQSTNSTVATPRNDGDFAREKVPTSLTSNNDQTMYHNYNHINPTNRIETLNNNRTVIHIGEPSLPSSQYTDTKSVSDIINRFNTLNTPTLPSIWDGQYRFTNDIPSVLIYHIRLPFETLMDSIRIQSDAHTNILKIFIEQQERSIVSQNDQQQQNKIIIRSTSRLCRLPRDRTYDYNNLRVVFLKDNFIRIELPTLN